tara:strand:- start:1177 stop:2244 length:1068 start_codon:yes stop_codon:yes gene_type:complete
MSIEVLFQPLRLGALTLANRILMAPMTRSRATRDDLVIDMHVQYYQQRATAGLIISEGVHPSPNGKGYNQTPGIYNDAQQEAWAKVTAAVHAQGGAIACQLMHCGRAGHPVNKASGTEMLAPSAIAAESEIFTPEGMKPMPTPRALTCTEIPEVIAEYVAAAKRCRAAGFDAVELHATSGYLPAQFLSPHANQRTDNYGGSLENRRRFVVELMAALGAAIGPDRVGIRIAPGNAFNDNRDDDPEATFAGLIKALSGAGYAWLHVIRVPNTGLDNLALARTYFDGPVIGNDSYNAEEAAEAIAADEVDAVSFGRGFISNPDLPKRFKIGAELNKFDRKTLYAGAAPGFIDYPSLDQ